MPPQSPMEVDESSPFTLNNIPFGIFSTKQDPQRRPATIIGEHVLDLRMVESEGLLSNAIGLNNGQGAANGSDQSNESVFAGSCLNVFASCSGQIRRAVRKRIIELLSDPESKLYSDNAFSERVFVPVAEANLHLPMQIGGFTDFLTSRVHAENCAKLAGQNLHESFDHFPTAYNGRASSVIVSSAPVPRPRGMIRKPGTPKYEFAPTSRLDFELEMGIFISQPVPFGQTKILTADEASDHIFGLVLLNDWSARDVQFAEMIPLGPFNGKGTATSISPWVVVPEALTHCQSATSSEQARINETSFAKHFQQTNPEQSTWDIDLEASIVPSGAANSSTLCRSNLKCGYWSPAQMIAHHASSGCGLGTGDLIGTGTLSGPGHIEERPTLGCLHELTMAGTKPIRLQGQEKKEMVWLEDGDEVVFTGWASGEKKVGFGELRGKIVERQ